MSNQIQLNSLQPAPARPTPQLSYLEHIIDQKVKGAALTCFESFVHWILTTLSCLYPAYDRLYQAEVAKLSAANATSGPLPSETPAVALTAARTLSTTNATQVAPPLASPLHVPISTPAFAADTTPVSGSLTPVPSVNATTPTTDAIQNAVYSWQ